MKLLGMAAILSREWSWVHQSFFHPIPSRPDMNLSDLSFGALTYRFPLISQFLQSPVWLFGVVAGYSHLFCLSHTCIPNARLGKLLIDLQFDPASHISC